MAVALVKFQTRSVYKRKLYDAILTNNNNDSQLIHVVARLLGDRFIYTNPSFSTPIEEHDYILVVGDIILSRENRESLVRIQSFV